MKYLGLLFVCLLVFTVTVSYVVIAEGEILNIVDMYDDALEDDKANVDIPEDIINISDDSISEQQDIMTLVGSESFDFTVSVYDIEKDAVTRMELDDYLCGVVFAEMPSSFGTEALKAQAVAARSFCIYKMLYSTESERELHNGADICTDFAHCKAYISYHDAVSRTEMGEEYVSPLWERVKNAVLDTTGEIIVYDSEPAIAVFHAISNNTTESAENIWGGSVPYLVSVPTSEGENSEAIKDFLTTSLYSSEEFKAKLTANGFRCSFSETPNLWIDINETVLNSSGRVDSMTICGKAISGRRLREIFSLRSTDFSLEYKDIDDTFVFSVKGYGHGVGMSQYGANLMAEEGKSYEFILSWYYTGVEIANMYDMQQNTSDIPTKIFH